MKHPYTYSCDLIRYFAGYGETGTKLSRADASKIRAGIATVIGMKDEELAVILSKYYQEHECDIIKESVKNVLDVIYKDKEIGYV